MSNISKHLKKLSGIRHRRTVRVRSVVKGSAARPRLVVQRSLKHFRAQLIDDTAGVVIAAVDDKGINSGTGIERATKVGTLLAAAAKAKGVESVVFDRRFYRFHGRVQAFAQAAREAGLNF